jgi:uncharacterized protein
MGNSLQDQFLKLGLANKKQVNKIKKKKHQLKKTKAVDTEALESKTLAQKAQNERQQRDRQLNRKKKKKIQKNEIAGQIRQLIETNRLTMEEGDTPYKFSDNNVIKRLFLTKEISDQLSNGKLAIVRQAGEYQIIPAETAFKIQKLNRNQIVLLHKPKKVEADDPYAEFEVPDDLMW